MKKRIQGMIIGFLIATLIFSGIFTAYASNVRWENIRVAYDNYKIYIDGELFEARDRTGVIEPFTYNGWIYAPFEHIARALGKNARWESSTRSLYLTTPEVPPPPRPRVTYFFDVLTPFESRGSSSDISPDNSFRMLGDEYTRGWRFWVGGSRNTTGSHVYNLRGHYKAIKGVLGHIDGESRNVTGTLSFYVGLERTLHRQFPVIGTMSPIEIEIDVSGVDILTIEWTNNGGDGGWGYWAYGFGNVTIE